MFEVQFHKGEVLNILVVREDGRVLGHQELCEAVYDPGSELAPLLFAAIPSPQDRSDVLAAILRNGQR